MEIVALIWIKSSASGAAPISVLADLAVALLDRRQPTRRAIFPARATHDRRRDSTRH